MLREAANGFGFLGLGALLADERARRSGGPRREECAGGQDPALRACARARKVILLFMHGGPSSIDTFDPKPYLDQNDGKPLPIKRPLSFSQKEPGPLMKSPWEFRPGGASGLPVSDLFPHVRESADELCVIRSMVGEGVDHGAALLQSFTGTFTFTRPSLGAWTLYGLGSENRDLPGYITIKPALSHGGAKNWSSAFLPGSYQGCAIGHAGMQVKDIRAQPIEYLVNRRLTREQQRYELDMLQAVNRRNQELWKRDDELETRIQSFEMAFRMQAEAARVFDVSNESAAVKKLYGLDNPTTADFGWQCLLARRLAERDVRFVQCTHSYKWDQHADLVRKHTANAAEVDQPIGALLQGPEVARHARRHAGRVDGRVRADARLAGRQRPRPQPLRLFHLDGRRGRQRRLRLRVDGRDGLSRGGKPDARPRFPRHAARPARHRPREADLPLFGPGFSPDGRSRERPSRHFQLAFGCLAVSGLLL